MAEYIDRENAQIFLRTECLAKYPTSFANGLLAAVDQLNKLPTADVVEVVRCKDCIYCSLNYPAKMKGEEPQAVYSCQVHRHGVSPDEFCCYGERKEQK